MKTQRIPQSLQQPSPFRRPLWSWGLIPYAALIVLISVAAATRTLPTDVFQASNYDKLFHFLGYGTLALFAVTFFDPTRWRVTLPVILLLAIGEEISQLAFPARTFDLRDLAANIVGIALFARLAVWNANDDVASADIECGR